MKVLVQWTRLLPGGWEIFDSSQWSALPSKAAPPPLRGRVDSGIDGAPGWVNRLNIQGVEFVGYDHYAVEAIPGGGCRATLWKDDPEDLAVDDALSEFYARVWTFLPLAPDPRFGGAYNTQQSQVVYAGLRLTQFYVENPAENTEVRPWTEFVPPPEAVTRHGIWLSDALMEAHDARLTVRGWREWTEGLPAEEVVSGRLRPQRALGRYDQPIGTKTVFARDTDLATGVHVALSINNENEFNEATGVAATEASANLVGGASGRLFVFTSLADFPNDAAWPTGDYRFQIDATAQGGDISFGLRTAGASTGHFARVDSGLTTDLETKAQIEALFTGTGLKLATTGSVSWTAGATGDRFECDIAGTRPASHGNQSLTLELNESDDFADGPWTAGGTTFFQTLAATAVGSPVMVKGISKTLAVSAVGAATVQKGVGKTLAVSGVGAAILQKSVGKTLAVSAVGTAVLDPAFFTSITMATTAVGIASLSALQVIGKTLATTAVGVASLTKLIKKTLTAIAVGVVTAQKRVGKTLNATAVGAPTLDPALFVSISLPATAVGTPTLTPIQVIGQTLLATAVGIASFSKLIKKTLTATAVGVATKAKKVSKILAATAVGAPSLSTARVFIQTLSAVAVGLASLVPQFIEGTNGAVQRMRKHFAMYIGWFGGPRGGGRIK